MGTPHRQTPPVSEHLLMNDKSPLLGVCNSHNREFKQKKLQLVLEYVSGSGKILAKRNTKLPETWAKEFWNLCYLVSHSKKASLKERCPVFALLGRTDNFWMKANAIHFGYWTTVWWMKEIIYSEANISKNMDLCKNAQKSKIASYSYPDVTSSLKPQSNLNRRKTTWSSTRIFHWLTSPFQHLIWNLS